MELKVGVINGDGVGPEMMAPAVLVLKAISKKYGHSLELVPIIASGEAIEAFGDPMPEDSLEKCVSCQAVLLGNTGLKKYHDRPLRERPEYALMSLRRGMAVSTNIRPVKLYPELSAFSPLKEGIVSKGLDFVFVRDILGGILTSDKITADGAFGREAFEYEYYNETIIWTTAKIAFDIASKRDKRIASLDKSNVLESSRLWRSIVNEISLEYNDVELSHTYIDTAAMKIVTNPEEFDVIVTSNLFGDIIADEGTALTGTPYLFGSAELGKQGKGIYTPNQLHHPDESIIGKQVVNPIGMIAAVALMFRFSFGLEQEAQEIESALTEIIRKGYRTSDIAVEGENWLTTLEIGEKILEELN